MHVIDELALLDPSTLRYESDPHGVHRELLANGPLARHPFGVAVLGYREVQTVLRDRRFVTPKAQALRKYGVTSGPLYDRLAKSIISLDGAEHQRVRRLVAQAFTPHAADRLRQAMRSIIAALVDDCGARFDVVEVVRGYPSAVICDLLGVPSTDWPFVSRITDELFRQFLPTVAQDQARILSAVDEMNDYLDGLFDARRGAGLRGDDLVTELIRAEDCGDQLTHAEVHMLISALLTAGTDTTRNQLAAAVEAFARHPGEWERLRSQPDLVGSAVDEALRYCPVVHGVYRLCVEDAVIADVPVDVGTFVHVMTSAANRDPRVFREPDRFDIGRRGPQPHHSFGGGIHYCLGAHLAKAEMAEALTTMSQRWVSVALDGPVRWKPRSGAISGPAALPVQAR